MMKKIIIQSLRPEYQHHLLSLRICLLVKKPWLRNGGVLIKGEEKCSMPKKKK